MFVGHSIGMRFGEASSLVANGRKSILLFSNGHREEIEYIAKFFGVEIKKLENGLTSLGYRSKPNKYTIRDWSWSWINSITDWTDGITGGFH